MEAAAVSRTGDDGSGRYRRPQRGRGAGDRAGGTRPQWLSRTYWSGSWETCARRDLPRVQVMQAIASNGAPAFSPPCPSDEDVQRLEHELSLGHSRQRCCPERRNAAAPGDGFFRRYASGKRNSNDFAWLTSMMMRADRSRLRRLSCMVAENVGKSQTVARIVCSKAPDSGCSDPSHM